MAAGAIGAPRDLRHSMLAAAMAFALPDPETADAHGLVYVGGELDPETVIAAYRQGLFPWRGGAAIPWYSPDPRGVVGAGRVRASHKTRQHARGRGWTVAFDRDFAGAMQRCASTPRAHEDGTWITPDVVASYVELHRRGVGHAVEVYDGDAPIGGLYGLTFGRFFHGESMYFRASGASKLALWALSECLAARGFELIDCQVPTRHLISLGAEAWPRRRYLARLRANAAAPSLHASWADWVAPRP